MAPDREIEVVRLEGLVPYPEGLRLQEERRRAVEAGEAPNTLYMLQHAPVFTLGRNAHEEHILAARDELGRLGIEVHEAGRGGDVTYHGPGQLVAYPLLDLKQWKPAIRWYLRQLEQVLIDVLAGYGLEGERVEGLTGVWVGGAKVAAIGVGLHRWVTFHGLALNVDPAMEHFGLIVPCGIQGKPVTSLRQLLGEPPPMGAVMDRLEAAFLDAFFESA